MDEGQTCASSVSAAKRSSARIDRRLMQLVRLSPPVLGLAGRPRMELPDMVIVANCAPSR